MPRIMPIQIGLETGNQRKIYFVGSGNRFKNLTVFANVIALVELYHRDRHMLFDLNMNGIRQLPCDFGRGDPRMNQDPMM